MLKFKQIRKNKQMSEKDTTQKIKHIQLNCNKIQTNSNNIKRINQHINQSTFKYIAIQVKHSNKLQQTSGKQTNTIFNKLK